MKTEKEELKEFVESFNKRNKRIVAEQKQQENQQEFNKHLDILGIYHK